MSARELSRAEVLSRVEAGHLSLVSAATVLAVSYRKRNGYCGGIAGTERRGCGTRVSAARRIGRQHRRRASGRWR